MLFEKVPVLKKYFFVRYNTTQTLKKIVDQCCNQSTYTARASKFFPSPKNPTNANFSFDSRTCLPEYSSTQIDGSCRDTHLLSEKRSIEKDTVLMTLQYFL